MKASISLEVLGLNHYYNCINMHSYSSLTLSQGHGVSQRSFGMTSGEQNERIDVKGTSDEKSFICLKFVIRHVTS